MITGATAAIIYGQPRVTNDGDLVVALKESDVVSLAAAFPEEEFYFPPIDIVKVELTRSQRGHLNIIHFASGYKADLYIIATDPLHKWALPLRRTIKWGEESIWVAPPEYVILRKLEYFREGGSSKHVADIKSIFRTTALDQDVLISWANRLGVHELLKIIQTGD